MRAPGPPAQVEPKREAHMSNDVAEITVPESASGNVAADADAAGAAGKPAPEPVKKSCSPGLTAWMRRHRVSVAFTSYQSGRVYLLGSDPKGRLSFHERIYQRAMGIVGNGQRLFMGGLYQIWRFENILRPGQTANEFFDRCYVPRNAHFTGAIDIHELGIRKGGGVVFINTLYNSLCVPSVAHSFKVIWKPGFISAIVPEDRCHLNGLAMRDGQPKYVTAVCRSDTIDGWRDRRHDGGVVIDVETDEIVCEGLSMPHSPRWADGKLWVLNSGTGHLGTVDFATRRFVPHVFCPGFLRGLAIKNGVAAVGLSKPRSARFDGLELQKNLEQKDSEAWCGVQFIDLGSGTVTEWVRLDGPVTELFDVTFIDDVTCPMALGQQSPENLTLVSVEDGRAGQPGIRLES
jgi:uncharacterized protein (TIGR03032 family)